MGSTDIPDIFKAYDIRGLVGSELTPDFAFATGAAFARFIIQEREPGTIVVGEECVLHRHNLQMHFLLELPHLA